ncbi:MAG: hypothetical protein AVDCRST_MAG57-3105, partial [uncultured Blastococcus sp.]
DGHPGHGDLLPGFAVGGDRRGRAVVAGRLRGCRGHRPGGRAGCAERCGVGAVGSGRTRTPSRARARACTGRTSGGGHASIVPHLPVRVASSGGGRVRDTGPV